MTDGCRDTFFSTIVESHYATVTEWKLDFALASCAIEEAVARHAGTIAET